MVGPSRKPQTLRDSRRELAAVGAPRSCSPFRRGRARSRAPPGDDRLLDLPLSRRPRRGGRRAQAKRFVARPGRALSSRRPARGAQLRDRRGAAQKRAVQRRRSAPPRRQGDRDRTGESAETREEAAHHIGLDRRRQPQRDPPIAAPTPSRWSRRSDGPSPPRPCAASRARRRAREPLRNSPAARRGVRAACAGVRQTRPFSL